MSRLKNIYYWFISPSDLEDMPGIKEGFGARLRKAGVKSPSQLYCHAHSSASLGELAKAAGLDRDMLQRAVERSRKPWYRNHKFTGILAIVFGIVSIVGGYLTYKAKKEANDATKKLENLMNEMRREQTGMLMPAWNLKVEAEFLGVPSQLYSEYYADIAAHAGPIFIGPDGKPTINLTESGYLKLQQLMTEKTNQFFIGRWFSFKSETTDNLFAGILLIHLSDSPPLRLVVHACSEVSQRPLAGPPTRERRPGREPNQFREPRQCAPVVQLMVPKLGPVLPEDKHWVRLGQNTRAGWSSKFKTRTLLGPGREPVTFSMSYGPDELASLVPTIGRLNLGAFQQTPSIEFCVPATRAKKVKTGDVISFIADIPDDVVKLATETLPDRINLLVALNSDPVLEHYYSYGLKKAPTYAADALCFQYDLAPQ